MWRPRMKVSWLVAGGFAVVLGGWGLVSPHVYSGLIAPETRPGAWSQDLVSVVVGGALCGVAVTARDVRPKLHLVGLGLLGYLFYAYGIYAIERVYNLLYLGYLAIFATAFWSLLFGAVAAAREWGPGASLDRRARQLSAVGALLQPVVFYPLWITMLIPLMVDRRQIDSLYSIFVLDLCFIMPAFLFVALGTWAGRGTALVLAPVMYVLGAALILSLALGELAKPLFDLSTSATGLVPAAGLTFVFLGLSILHLTRLRLPAPGSPAELPPRDLAAGAGAVAG